MFAVDAGARAGVGDAVVGDTGGQLKGNCKSVAPKRIGRGGTAAEYKNNMNRMK